MTKPIRTLLVDDEPAIVALHRLYLSDLPEFVVVASANTPSEAAEILSTTGIDLVLLDESMPSGSGTALLAWLRAVRSPPVDVIMITASQDFATVEAARLGGAADYLVKPFTPELFRQRLLDFAARREQRASAAASAALAQEQVDTVFGLSGPAPATTARALPKGLSPETAKLVATALVSHGHEATAAEIAQHCGLSRVTARRYLDFLASAGLVTVKPRYGQRGRPVIGYRLN